MHALRAYLHRPIQRRRAPLARSMYSSRRRWRCRLQKPRPGWPQRMGREKGTCRRRYWCWYWCWYCTRGVASNLFTQELLWIFGKRLLATVASPRVPRADGSSGRPDSTHGPRKRHVRGVGTGAGTGAGTVQERVASNLFTHGRYSPYAVPRSRRQFRPRGVPPVCEGRPPAPRPRRRRAAGADPHPRAAGADPNPSGPRASLTRTSCGPRSADTRRSSRRAVPTFDRLSRAEAEQGGAAVRTASTRRATRRGRQSARRWRVRGVQRGKPQEFAGWRRHDARARVLLYSVDIQRALAREPGPDGGTLDRWTKLWMSMTSSRCVWRAVCRLRQCHSYVWRR